MNNQQLSEALQAQNQKLLDLTSQHNALIYIFTQTLTMTLRQHPNPASALLDMQAHFAEKAAKSGVTADAPDKGLELAERIFTAAKASL